MISRHPHPKTSTALTTAPLVSPQPPSSALTILALDMSSTKIGMCYDGVMFETITLKGDIAERCKMAQQLIRGWLFYYANIDLVVIESPVARFANAVIPQARVSGAVLSEIADHGIAWHEVSPAAAKKALTGDGRSGKQTMIEAAPAVCADEHQADAYGLWLAGKQLRVEVSR